ncbi:hypothetical protein D5W64_13395 [Salmonella enterica subsp. enterica serovar Saintpaul]|nr:hypothetical protein [Salmonella enterica subsp. enterica serovar Saintpaul]
MTFNDDFLKEVIDGQRRRNSQVVGNFTQELKPLEKPQVMIQLPLELIEIVLDDISRGHDHTDESLKLSDLVKKFKKTL